MSEGTPRRPVLSLRSRLVTLVAGLAVPLLVLQVGWSVHDYRSAREHAENNALAVADAISLGVTQFFGQAQELMMAAATPLGPDGLRPESCTAHVRNAAAVFPFLRNVLGVDADGTVICSALPAPPNVSARDWPWFRGVQAEPEFTLGPPVEGDISGGWILPLVAPVVDDEGRFAGAMVGTVELVELSRLFGGLSIPPDHLVTVATSDRIVIARSTDAERRVGSHLPDLTGSDREVAPGRWVATGPDLTGVPRTWGQVEIAPGWIVYVGVPDTVVFGPARAEALLYVGASLLVMLLGILFAGRSYARIAAALRELALATGSTARGESVPVPPDTPIEVSAVVEQFNRTLAERDRAESAERAARERFVSLFENAVVGLYVSSVEGGFLQVNPALVEMLGYDSEDELLAVGVESLYTDPSVRARFVREAVETGRAPSGEVEWLRKDGTPITVRIGGTTIRGPSGEPVFEMIVQDITEERRTEEELRQTQKMEAIGKLAGGIAHDFNNILTVIGGNVELLEDEIPASNQLSEDLGQISQATRRAASLTRRLLAFSRRQRGGIQVVDVREAVSDLAKMLVPFLGETITLRVECPDEPLLVEIDPGDLEQVVLNLVLNARDALPRGGRIRIAAGREEASSASQPVRVVLQVEDDGVGIDPATRPRIFEPFYTTKPMGQGTGLGLSTVYGIVQRASGSIEVSSEPGLGTTMTIRLPMTDATRAPAATTEAGGLETGTERILVVEDDPMVRRFVVRALSDAGYDVRVAESGEQALDVVRAEDRPPDLVLTDVVMPGIDGREFAETLALTHPGTPVLFMSGYIDDRIMSDVFDERPESILRKPFSASTLRLAIRAALARDRSATGQD